MNNLYRDLASVYQLMYRTFIDYDAEFTYYGKIMAAHQCRSVLEIGCGTGNLAQRILAENILQYTGLDISADMLDIARKQNPEGHFLQGDMRDAVLNTQYDCVLIPGRSMSYLRTNQDVLAAFSTFFNAARPGGLLCFDMIDASTFIPAIDENKVIEHRVVEAEAIYLRESVWKKNLDMGFTWDWYSTYYLEKDNTRTLLGRDDSTLRTFTAEEITILLTISGWKVRAITPRPSYAFDTLVVEAIR